MVSKQSDTSRRLLGCYTV